MQPPKKRVTWWVEMKSKIDCRARSRCVFLKRKRGEEEVVKKEEKRERGTSAAYVTPAAPHFFLKRCLRECTLLSVLRAVERKRYYLIPWIFLDSQDRPCVWNPRLTQPSLNVWGIENVSKLLATCLFLARNFNFVGWCCLWSVFVCNMSLFG